MATTSGDNDCEDIRIDLGKAGSFKSLDCWMTGGKKALNESQGGEGKAKKQPEEEIIANTKSTVSTIEGDEATPPPKKKRRQKDQNQQEEPAAKAAKKTVKCPK